MNKLFPSIWLCGAVIIGAARCADAATIYDLSSGFSLSANPAGPWTLGTKTNLSSGIVPFGVKGTTSLNGVPIEYWQLMPAQEPTIYRNATATTATFGNILTIPPGTVWFYAGVTASPYAFGAVRFTVPTGGAGSYIIESAVAPTYDAAPQGDTDYHVVHNGTELFGQFLAPADRTGYTNTIVLADGDTIDFLVGRGADNNNYGSGLKLKARLVNTNTPPPSPWLTEYDLSSSYSTEQNPNGPWSFGWTETLSSTFHLLTYQSDFASDNGVALADWRVSASQIPGVSKVVGPGVAVSAGGAFTAPSGTVYATPGNDGTSRNFATIRFTVPANQDGVYRIESDVKPIFDGAVSGDSDFHVVKNGHELFGVFLPPNTTSGFTNLLTLHAGDTIDFSTGRGADGLHADRTALKVRAWLAKTESLPPLPPPSAGLVQNGSFELGVNPGISADLPGPDSTSITGWTIENASVDYIGTRWVAGDGARCLDLSGTDAATISQMISGLTAGQTYRLSFLMAANPEVSTYVARLRTTIANVSSEFEFSQPGITTGNLGWTQKSVTFTASASSHKLSFISLNPGWAGAALDKVEIAELTPLVANGSFEHGIDPGISTDLPGPDSTSITGWTIENASVDYIGSRWVAGDGLRCLDLSGTDAATISQMVSGLTPGQTYKLSFLMAANPEVPTYTARVRVAISGDSAEFTFNQTGITTANLGWVEKSLNFVAASASQKLSFISLNPGWAGAALDRVAIIATTNAPPPPPVGLVVNGSFEQGIDPGISTDLPGPDSTSITGWTIENASVDYIGTRWVAADGQRCLELNGTDAATISQMISGLAPGQQYRLSFWMAANPETGIQSGFRARLRASIGDASHQFEFLQSTISTTQLGWLTYQLDFTASSSSHKLSFTSLTPGWAGATLDRVAIIPTTNPPPPPPPSQLVVNGSFEQGIDPGASGLDISGPNSTSITGWTVENASVDYVGSRWAAGDGSRCIDLSGTDAATLSQMISGLTPGQEYRLSFLMAANPEVPTYTARARVIIADTSNEVTFDQPGITTSNLGWTEKSVSFTATASSHKLSFISLNPGWAGATLDKVAIIAVTNTPPPPPPGLVSNGSFELGITPGISTDLPGPDSTSITGWTIENASVDYIGSRWVAGDGLRCLDLSGTDAATISQMVSGLTPGQAYKLSFLMAANPEVGQFTALLQATVGTRSRRFSFTQTGFTTANLGWSEKVMYFRAASENQKLSFTSLNPGWAGAALDKITITVENNPPPFNTPPVAKALASPLFTVWPDQTSLMVIAVDGTSASTIFDGSFSSDEDGDPLTFWWTKDDEASPFAATPVTTNTLSAGLHHVTLVVDDAEDDSADTLEIEVITLDESLEEIRAAIIESDLLRKDKRPLFATLERVSDAFNNGRLQVGIRQLHAFQQKVRAQVASQNPNLAVRLKHASGQIIEAVEIFLDAREAKDDDKGDRK